MTTNLQPCRDCGESVSIRATACPRCGCPVDVAVKPAKVQRKSKARLVAGGAVAVVLLVLLAVTYRHWAFASAMTRAEQSDLLNPDLASLEQARGWAWFDSEKARVKEVETRIAVAEPVARFVEAYNGKDINEMLAQLDHQGKIAMAKLLAKIIQYLVPISVPSFPGADDLKQLSALLGDSGASLEQIVKWLADHDAFGSQLELEPVKIAEVVINGDQASLNATVKHRLTVTILGIEWLGKLGLPDVSQLKIKLTLNKTDKGWLIDRPELLPDK